MAHLVVGETITSAWVNALDHLLVLYAGSDRGILPKPPNRALWLCVPPDRSLEHHTRLGRTYRRTRLLESTADHS